MGELMTPWEVAAVFGVCVRMVDRMAKGGALTPVRIGRAVMLRRADVERFLDTKSYR